ncbi:MAG: hypothetical protein JWN41_264, partial [Thermoleophilia bacterium]|nr:hypothetical protein [Thermoleophilia bacterium]
GGELLAWHGLHTNLGAAIMSWPFVWLDPDLGIGGPAGGFETAVWLIGIVLLIVALIFAIERNERRELGVLVGSIGAAALAIAVAAFDRAEGIRLLEYTLLVTSPLLAALALRAVALAREGAAERSAASGIARLSGVGPTVLVCGFAVLSLAATAVTGSRMVHAPALRAVNELRGGSTLVAGGDTWLAFVVDGDRACGTDSPCYTDADVLASPNPPGSIRSITFGRGYDQLALSNSPLGSDPPTHYLEQSLLDGYQARLFDNLRSDLAAPAPDPVVDQAAGDARIAAEKAGRETVTLPRDAAGNVTDKAIASLLPEPLRHEPVEPDARADRSDQPAGLLLPSAAIDGCGVQDAASAGACQPADPVPGAGECTSAEIAAVGPSPRSGQEAVPPAPTVPGGSDQPAEDAATAGSPIEAGTRDAPATHDEDYPLATGVADPGLADKPALLGVQCFDVDLAGSADALVVHTRDVGLILAPEDAVAAPKDSWNEIPSSGPMRGGIDGNVRMSTSANNASLEYGNGKLAGTYDMTLEGTFGAGVALAGAYAVSSDAVESTSPLPLSPIGELRGSANGFSQIERNVGVIGNITVADRSGTAAELGRLFARPRDLPPSCNFSLTLPKVAGAAGDLRRLRTVTPNSSGQNIIRDGLTVAVTAVHAHGARRTARVVIGSYLTHRGMPRYQLVDWTEQYAGKIEVEGCDGVVHHAGVDDNTGRNAVDGSVDGATAADVLDALGGAN